MIIGFYNELGGENQGMKLKPEKERKKLIIDN
jgi:hypothetical protein